MTKAGFAHARHVLVLNSGSSSLKFGLFAVTASEVRVVVSGAAEYTLHKLMRFWAMDAQHVQVCEETQPWVGVAEVVSRIARSAFSWIRCAMPRGVPLVFTRRPKHPCPRRVLLRRRHWLR